MTPVSGPIHFVNSACIPARFLFLPAQGNLTALTGRSPMNEMTSGLRLVVLCFLASSSHSNVHSPARLSLPLPAHLSFMTSSPTREALASHRNGTDRTGVKGVQSTLNCARLSLLLPASPSLTCAYRSTRTTLEVPLSFSSGRLIKELHWYNSLCGAFLIPSLGPNCTLASLESVA